MSWNELLFLGERNGNNTFFLCCYGIIQPTGKHYNPTNSTTLLNKEWYSQEGATPKGCTVLIVNELN